MSATPPSRQRLAEAVARVRSGGLVAYPTETVFGLGADARSGEAMARLARWKGRPAEHPVSVLVTGLEAARALGVVVSPAARRLAETFWPGPVTLVVPGPGALAPGVARADGAVGLRCSPHPVASLLARRLEEVQVGPITATSLNRSGEPPARSYEEARSLCETGEDEAWLVEDLGPDAWGEDPSSVVDLTGHDPVVLRVGPIDGAVLTAVLAEDASR